MGFLYGSYTKEEENFSLSKKMKEREDNLWTIQMTKFYKKVRVFQQNYENSVEENFLLVDR